MKDRITVRRTAPREWTITRPRIGFGPPEIHTATTAPAAWRWLRTVEKTRGGGAAAERAHGHRDGLGAIPGWEPYRYRYARRSA